MAILDLQRGIPGKRESSARAVSDSVNDSEIDLFCFAERVFRL